MEPEFGMTGDTGDKEVVFIGMKGTEVLFSLTHTNTPPPQNTFKNPPTHAIPTANPFINLPRCPFQFPPLLLLLKYMHSSVPV